MKTKYILLIFTLFIFQFSSAQDLLDSCFTSATPAVNFISTSTLANMGPEEADVMEWTGSSWTGAWPHANLTIPPPRNASGCRAMFLGNANTWTYGGEGFGVKLNSPLIAGHTYSFNITYVSHGVGSDGAFSPAFYTSSTPDLIHYVGNMPAVGNTWTTNTFTFTATAAQSGDTWLILTTATNGSSGMISSFCKTCNNPAFQSCDVNLGNDKALCDGETFTLDATTPHATYLWQDNSTDPTFNVTQQGTYRVTVTTSDCSKTDSISINYNPNPVVNLGNDTTLCQGASIVLDATTPHATYEWQDHSSRPTFNAYQQGTYRVKITVNNCSGTDAILIHKTVCDVALEIPNLITPNNDGLNDVFVPILSKGIVSMHTTVYNSWGSKVFETNNLLIEWNAKGVSDGVYYWIVDYEDINGVKDHINGYLTVLDN